MQLTALVRNPSPLKSEKLTKLSVELNHREKQKHRSMSMFPLLCLQFPDKLMPLCELYLMTLYLAKMNAKIYCHECLRHHFITHNEQNVHIYF